MNRTCLRNGTMQALRLFACGVFATALAGCEGQIIEPPVQQASMLSYKYPGICQGCPELTDQVEEAAYYCSIGVTGDSATNGIDPVNCAANQRPTLTLDAWKMANGFPATGHPDAHAIYGNLGDLRIARDMNCLKSANDNVACYVTNYGPPPCCDAFGHENSQWIGGISPTWPRLGEGIRDAIAGHAPFATVAMVYNRSAALNQGANSVTFYVFNGHGDLLFSPALDGQGGKTNPRMCMACHGGTYDSGTHSATRAQFLPFDVFYFEHNGQPGYTLDDQQEAYRKLNALVKDTEPAAAIADFVDGTYNNAVNTPGSLAVEGYVPQGWAGQETLYNGVYRQYCRMCHLASSVPFLQFNQFKNSAGAVQEKVCHSMDMPNAEVPNTRFWLDTVAQDDLRSFLLGQGLTDLHSCN